MEGRSRVQPSLTGSRLRPDAVSFSQNIARERHPNLRWEFSTWGKSNVAYQRHVIMGFSTEDPKFHTNININRVVATYAHQIIESLGSIPSHGTLNVRGAAVDIGAAAARHRGREIETDVCSDGSCRWLRSVPERDGERLIVAAQRGIFVLPVSRGIARQDSDACIEQANLGLSAP